MNNTAHDIVLYEFGRSSQVWRYTSADRAINYGGHDWAPAAISDDGQRMTGEISADTLRITLPALVPVAQLFRAVPPSEEVFVTVYEYDPADADANVCWVGSISGVAFTGIHKAELACDSLDASMQRPGLTLRYERSCVHTLFNSQCGVDKAAHALACNVSSLNGAAITVTLAGGGVPGDLSSYRYGAIEWDDDGATEMRSIESVNGDALELLGGTYGLTTGMSVTLYPSCDGLRSTCNDRFHNIDNHGGFPHMPGESIYGKRLW